MQFASALRSVSLYRGENNLVRLAEKLSVSSEAMKETLRKTRRLNTYRERHAVWKNVCRRDVVPSSVSRLHVNLFLYSSLKTCTVSFCFVVVEGVSYSAAICNFLM